MPMQLWDVRTQAPIVSFSHHEDFISDFAVDDANTTLLAAGYGSAIACMIPLRIWDELLHMSNFTAATVVLVR